MAKGPVSDSKSLEDDLLADGPPLGEDPLLESVAAEPEFAAEPESAAEPERELFSQSAKSAKAAEVAADPAAALGEALAEATKVLKKPKRKPAPAPAPAKSPAPAQSWNRFVLPGIVVYLVFLTTAWLWPSRSKEVHEPATEPVKQEHADVPRPTGVDLWDEAVRAAREKRHADAVALFERHANSSSLSSTERLLVYQQLAIECRLAGQIEESMKYAGLAQAQTIRTWTPEDLLQLAEAAFTEGRAQQARRLFARVLLLQGSLPDHLKDRIPVAALRLGDSYREEADRAEKNR